MSARIAGRRTFCRTFSQIASFVGVLYLFVGVPARAQETQPSVYSSANRYDGTGRVVGEIAPDPDGDGPLRFGATRTRFNALGLRVSVEAGELSSWQPSSVAPNDWPGFTITSTQLFEYDTMSRRVKTSILGSNGQLSSVTQFNYDKKGRPVCTAFRMNSATWGALPASACTPGVGDRITRTIYDAAGQVVQVRKGVGSANEVADVTYSYTPNGKVSEVVDANGNRVRYDYDGLDRLSRWSFPLASRVSGFDDASPDTALATAGQPNLADYEEYGYDLNGNRDSLRKRDGSLLTYQYDALNRVTAKIVPDRAGLAWTHRRNVYFAYDLRGLQTSARFDSQTGEGIGNTYDGFGRLKSTTQSLDGVSRTLGYDYDANGNRIQLTFPDNNTVTYQYDGLDRPIAILRSGSAVVASYSYDAAGRRNGMGGGVTTGFGYNPAGQLETLSHSLSAPNANVQWGFAYNAAGQITDRSLSSNAYVWSAAYNVDRPYTTNGLNQYTAAGAATFGYDVNANLTSDGSSTFLYDIENRLVSSTGAKTAGLRYDPLGRLYEVSGNSGTTRWLYDGDALVSEYDIAGNTLRRYVHGTDGAVDDPLAWYEGAAYDGSNERRLRTDWQGSIALVTDSGGGSVLATNRYDEYGIPQPGNAGRFQYTGQAYLPELGMYHYKARIYSPTLGRFLQTDPIGYKDQTNLYAYVGNDPLNGRDPTGMYEKDVHYSLTEVLALAAGISPSVARQIAAGDQGVDDNPATSPMGMSPAGHDVQIRADYHFTSESRRAELNSNFQKSGKAGDLGIYLHAKQDSYSHAEYGARFGHLFAGHAPDKTFNDVSKADAMARSTFSTLMSAKGRLGQAGAALPFSVIAPAIHNFNAAASAGAKSQALDALRGIMRQSSEDPAP